MLMSNNEYSVLTKKWSPGSPKAKDFTLAFVVGGLICVIGQLLNELYSSLGFTDNQVKMAVPTTLIFAAALLTGLKIFNKIAKHAGAGTFVPITGFANAVVSPAIEFKQEGWVLGLGANMFKIAGPVLVYGMISSAVYGIILYLVKIL
ncbi:MAG: stage V sporulation protein AC [Clostridia bacterium]|nr:stage V sporulation protein AC [Clostridia bacterium]